MQSLPQALGKPFPVSRLFIPPDQDAQRKTPKAMLHFLKVRGLKHYLPIHDRHHHLRLFNVLWVELENV